MNLKFGIKFLCYFTQKNSQELLLIPTSYAVQTIVTSVWLDFLVCFLCCDVCETLCFCVLCYLMCFCYVCYLINFIFILIMSFCRLDSFSHGQSYVEEPPQRHKFKNFTSLFLLTAAFSTNSNKRDHAREKPPNDSRTFIFVLNTLATPDKVST